MPDVCGHSAEYLDSSARILGHEDIFYFQQENHPKRTVQLTKEWRLCNALRRLITTPPTVPRY